MRKFHLRHKVSEGETHNISDKEASIVLSEGVEIEEPVRCISESGTFNGRIVFYDKNTVEVEIVQKVSDSTANLNREHQTVFVVGVTELKVFEQIIHQLQELEIDLLIPLVTELSDNESVKRLSDSNTRDRIVNAALKQCHSEKPVQVQAPIAIGEIDKELLSTGYKVALVTENIKTEEFKNSIKDLQKSDRITVAIGPRMGWHAKDIGALSNLGFKMVNLDMPILRVQTAVCYAASIINFIKR